MIRMRWTLVPALLFLALLGWYLLYTQGIVRALRADAEMKTQMFSEVQAGLSDPDPLRAAQALVRLQEIIVQSGVPLILSGPEDTVYDAVNLPFDVELDTDAGQERVRRYAERLALQNPPVGDPDVVQIHFGDPPELQRLRWIPWLQAGGLLLVFVLGIVMVRSQRRAEAEQAWSSMARELAHQLGTPISSLQGWLEVLRLSTTERPEGIEEREISDEMEADVERLERVSRRFELIGRDVELDTLDIRDLVRGLERYLQARMPKLGSGVELRVEIAPDTPKVMGNDVLLAWALENLVKNALDALAGRGGIIRLRVKAGDPGWVHVLVDDDGSGVDPEIRERIFEPGVTSKAGGWGVGLALTRRIVERIHHGRIELLNSGSSGSVFRMKLPVAEG